MKVSSIEEIGKEKFFTPFPIEQGFEKPVRDLWEQGISSPKFCFVLEKEDEIIGRVGFLGIPGNSEAIKMFGLILPSGDGGLKAGVFFLREAFNCLQKNGATRIFYHLHLKKGEPFEETEKILENAGMKSPELRKRYSMGIKDYRFLPENRLEYKNLNQVGKQLYIQTIMEVTRGTLDRGDLDKVEKLGESKAAEEYFSNLQDIDPSLENWFIGFLQGERVGLVIPQRLSDDEGTINYIGVIPGFRGSGFSRDFLDMGIKNLNNRGLKEVVAEIDAENFPLARILKEMGFSEGEEIKVFNYITEQN